jgi:hypothetical protein
MTEKAILGEPRIFVEVLRSCGDGNVRSRHEISLDLWLTARHPSQLAEIEINNALAEVDQYARR